MDMAEGVFIGRFEKPAEAMLRGGPEHEIQCNFAGEGVRCDSILPGVDPLRTSADHEFHLLGEGPRLLEQEIGSPFHGVAAEERRRARLKLKPVLNRGEFNGEVCAAARFGPFEVPSSGAAKLDGGRGLGSGRLGERASIAEKKQR